MNHGKLSVTQSPMPRLNVTDFAIYNLPYAERSRPASRGALLATARDQGWAAVVPDQRSSAVDDVRK